MRFRNAIGIISRQQVLPAQKALPGLRQGHGLAKDMGQKLGEREILLGCMPQETCRYQISS
jgi:hypothetical protein